VHGQLFDREITRRQALRAGGMGLGALALSRYMGAGPANAAETASAPLRLARVRPRSASQAMALMRFDDTHRRFSDGSIEILLWPGDAARLDALGIPYRIAVPDLVARDAELATIPTKMTMGPPGAENALDYRVLDDYVTELHTLPNDYPGLARTIELPERSLEGRPIYGIEIGESIDAVDGRPTFYIDGIHHAREWPAAEYPMSFAHFLLQGYGTDNRITNLLRTTRVTIIPIMNPDGFHYSRSFGLDNSNMGIVAGGQGAYWRKNRRSYVDETVADNPASYGVDPNRNYPFLWGVTSDGLPVNEAPVFASTSPNPYDQTYYGPTPLSEPENRNVASYILGHNVVGVITNHTVGPLVLRPWGHTAEETPDEGLMRELGDEMAIIMFNDPTRSQIGLGLYPTTGTTDDWAYAAISALGYTIEHFGGGQFHPAYNSPSGPGHVRNWPGVMEAFLVAAETITKPENHAVIRGRVVDGSGNPAKASLNLHKEFDTAMWQEGLDGIGPLLHQGEDVTHEVMNFDTETGGDGVIEWHVNPTTRPTEQTAGKTETATLSISTAGGTKQIDVLVRRGEALDLGDVSV